MRRMTLAWPLLCVLLVPLLLAATQVSTRAEVVRGLEADGYYVEPGAEQIDTARLDALIGDSRATLRPAVLADAPRGGEEQFANDVLDDLGSGTAVVVVVSPGDIGVASDRADSAQINAALDRADDRADSLDDLVGYLLAFDRELAQAMLDAEPAQAAGRSVSVWTIVLLVLAALVAVALIGQARRRRAERAWQERALRDARQEVGSQVSAVADRVVDLHSRVELAGEGEAARLYAAATDTYAKAQRHLEESTSVSELERVSDELDHARWQMESVSALLDGRQPPPEPDKKVACFFDPNHGAGTTQVTLTTAAGEREVRVCGDCAAKLEAGEAPQPRMIEMAGQRVPAAMAPRSYGGGGYGRLDDFTVLMGGRRHRYGWGGTYGPMFPYRRRSWFSPWGWGGSWGTGGSWGSGSSWGRPRRRTWGSSSWGTGSGAGSARRRSWQSSSRSTSRSSRSGGASRSRSSSSRSGASRSRSSSSRSGASRSRSSSSRGSASRSRGGSSRGGGSRRR